MNECVADIEYFEKKKEINVSLRGYFAVCVSISHTGNWIS
jgi:hypothetical protein